MKNMIIWGLTLVFGFLIGACAKELLAVFQKTIEIK
jgi:hypothetical protein